jgi:drug/metabolite transporter (DMT)-like permease
MPVFVAALSALVLGEGFNRCQQGGIALVVLGLLLFGATSIYEGVGLGWWKGDLLLVAAGFCFASYSVAQKKSGLSAWQATALVNIGSIVIFLPIHVFFLPSRLDSVGLADILVQTFAQGIWVAILGMVCYAQALRYLGAARGASFGALVPVVTTLLGALALGEQPPATVLVGALLVSLGVCAVLLGRKLQVLPPIPAVQPNLGENP